MLVRLCPRLGVEGEPLHDRPYLLERLEVTPVVEPGVAGPHPADPVGLHPVLQQPEARVRGGLAGAEHGIGVARSGGGGEVTDGDEPCTRRHLERRRMGRRDRAFQVAGVDDLATHLHVVELLAAEVPDPFTVTTGAQVVVARQDADPVGPRQPPGHLSEVPADLLAGRPLVVPCVLTALVDPVVAERQ